MNANKPAIVVLNDYTNTFSNALSDDFSVISVSGDGESVVNIASKSKPTIILVANLASTNDINQQLRNSWQTRDIPVLVASSTSVKEVVSEIRVTVLLRTSISSFRR